MSAETVRQHRRQRLHAFGVKEKTLQLQPDLAVMAGLKDEVTFPLRKQRRDLLLQLHAVYRSASPTAGAASLWPSHDRESPAGGFMRMLAGSGTRMRLSRQLDVDDVTVLQTIGSPETNRRDDLDEPLIPGSPRPRRRRPEKGAL